MLLLTVLSGERPDATRSMLVILGQWGLENLTPSLDLLGLNDVLLEQLG
jgi:hypothetical protein